MENVCFASFLLRRRKRNYHCYEACKLPLQTLRPNSDLWFLRVCDFLLLRIGEMDFKTILVWFTKQTYNLLSIFYSMFLICDVRMVIFSRTKEQYKNKLFKKEQRVYIKRLPPCACSVMSDSFAAPWTIAYQVPESIEILIRILGGCPFSLEIFLVQDSNHLCLLPWQSKLSTLSPPGLTL